MKAISEDIKDLLVAAGLVTFGTNLFIGEFPDNAPDTCYLLRDSGGFAPDDMIDGQIERPTIQLMVRGLDSYITNWERVNNAVTSILTSRHVTINSSQYSGIWKMSDVLFLGRDERNRYLHSVNLRANRKAV